MTDNTKYFLMLERMIVAGARRAGDADEADLEHFASLQKCLDEHLAKAVKAQRSQGKSWNDIGLALGISKQAAFKRFKER